MKDWSFFLEPKTKGQLAFLWLVLLSLISFTYCHTYLRRHRFNRDKPPKTGSSRPTQGHAQNMKLRWYPHVLYYSFSFQFRGFLVFFALLGIVEDDFHTRHVSKQKNQRSAMNCQIKEEGGLIPLWHCVKMVVHVFCGL